jgi:hypothetical protein
MQNHLLYCKVDDIQVGISQCGKVTSHKKRFCASSASSSSVKDFGGSSEDKVVVVQVKKPWFN